MDILIVLGCIECMLLMTSNTKIIKTNLNFRWNDFETNISNSFRELRSDNEFFDVTLCCDNGIDKLQAHKVILAACSPLFRRLLSPSNSLLNSSRHGSSSFLGTHVNSQPLLYLKGIHKRELEEVLNFMYHGEVNVAQESLNAFLAVAEELAVKGLTTESKNDNTSTQNRLVGLAMTDLGNEEFVEGSLDYPPSKKGQSLKRISIGGERASLKKNYGQIQTDRDRTSISSQPRAGLKKRISEGVPHDPSIEAKRVKSDPDSIQIGETSSLGGTEHSTSTGSGQVDTGEFVDEGSGDPDFEDNYGYTEGDLEDTGGTVSGNDNTKGKNELTTQ